MEAGREALVRGEAGWAPLLSSKEVDEFACPPWVKIHGKAIGPAPAPTFSILEKKKIKEKLRTRPFAEGPRLVDEFIKAYLVEDAITALAQDLGGLGDKMERYQLADYVPPDYYGAFRQHIFPRAPGEAGFALAGGSVSSVLAEKCRGFKFSKNEIYTRDLDVFAVGLSENEAMEKIWQFVAACTGAADEAVVPRPLVYMTDNCITVLLSNTKNMVAPFGGSTEFIEIQFITRLYKTIAEVLYSFDLAPSAVAYDGTEVWFTRQAAYAYRWGVFLPSFSKRRRTFEYRICKYIKRGFDLVLPNITDRAVELAEDASAEKAISMTTRTAAILLPYIHFNNVSCCDVVNYVYCYPLSVSRKVGEEWKGHVYGGKDESRHVYGALPYMNHDDLVWHNVKEIIRNKSYLVWRLSDNLSRKKWWELCLDNVERVITDRLFRPAPNRTWRHLVKFHKLLFEPSHVETLCAHARYEMCCSARATTSLAGHPPPEAGRREIEKRISTLAVKIREMASDFGTKTVRWKDRTEGNDLRLTAAFTLQLVSEKEWYGSWYKERL